MNPLVAALVWAPAGARRHGFAYHVLVDGRPACGVAARGVHLQVDGGSTILAGQARPRCQRHGCRVLWP